MLIPAKNFKKRKTILLKYKYDEKIKSNFRWKT